MLETPSVPRPPTRVAAPDATARLVRSVASIGVEEIPRAVLDRAALCVLDLVGVALAGGHTATAERARAVAAEEFGGDAATVLADGARLSAAGAALANGTAGHALDYDDVLSGSGHPSTVVIPAALAVGEQMGAGGPALIRAVVAGLETHAMLGAAVGPSHYARGFHSTATLGSFAAAAAAGMLRGLDDQAMRMAFGIAGTQAAGLKSMFGTDTKPLHAGRAAVNGVLAAGLAARGFTAAEDVLGVEQGFARTQSDGPLDLDALRSPGAGRWRTLDIQFKMHAACYLTHASMTALQDLLRDGAVRCNEVDRVVIAAPPGHFAVCAIAEPATGLEGKFSFRFTAALVLAGRGTGPSAFTDESVRDPALVALRDRIEAVPDPVLTGATARVLVCRRDGSTVEAARDMLNLDAARSGLAERLRAKFRENVEPVLGQAGSDRLTEAILALPDGGSAANIVALAAGMADE
jgi:2-methylcitrate dehydratase PrpD